MTDIVNSIHEWHPHNRKMIAYLRACDEMNLDQQYEELETYAHEHRLIIEETFCDIGMPMSGLHHAMEALETADGLIVCNLNRLVTHADNRLGDLRPLLHQFCSTSGKHLISIEEGINTSTAVGQSNALELINEVKDAV